MPHKRQSRYRCKSSVGARKRTSPPQGRAAATALASPNAACAPPCGLSAIAGLSRCKLGVSIKASATLGHSAARQARRAPHGLLRRCSAPPNGEQCTRLQSEHRPRHAIGPIATESPQGGAHAAFGKARTVAAAGPWGGLVRFRAPTEDLE